MKRTGSMILVVLMVFGLVFATPPRDGYFFAYGVENVTEFAGGDGSPENPFKVSTTEQLDNVRDYPDKNFILVNDIVFQAAEFAVGGAFYNSGPKWRPIGSNTAPFTGVFDGAGYTIRNLASLSEETSGGIAGLFGYNNGTIKNLNMAGTTLGWYNSTTARMGMVAYYNQGGTIINCTVSGSATCSSSGYLGGITAFNSGTIESCTNTGAISGYYAGGIAASNSSTGVILNCRNSGAVNSGYIQAGGIAGDNDGEIRSCINTGIITGVDVAAAGGIAANNDKTITQCVNSATVQGANSTGGIAGSASSSSSITDCLGTGKAWARVVGDYNRVGGLVGRNYGLVDRSCFLGTVGPTTIANLGGIVGLNINSGVVTNSYYLSGQGKVAQGTPISYTAFGTQATFAGFDFTSTWIMDSRIKRPVPVSARPDVYTVSYVLNSGVQSAAPVLYYMQGSYAPLGTPTRTGYAFLGWCTASALTDTPVKAIPADMKGNLKYYAKWGAPIVSATPVSYTSLKVSWSTATGATSYKIYRATSATGTYSLVYTATASARSWTNTGLVTGKTYYYKVCPVAGGKVYAFSTYKSCIVVPGAPTLKITQNPGWLALSWTAVPGASGYQVYRYNGATGAYVLAATITAKIGTTVFTSWNAMNTYGGSFKVRAYHIEGTTKVYGVFSAVVTK